MTGYLHPQYFASLLQIGTPVELPASRGCILKREIPQSSSYDAMGAYPIFCCRDWARLPQDLAGLTNELVTLALVADPFGNFTERSLHDAFPDLVLPFKEHFVLNLSQGLDGVSRHHRINARKALATVEVEISRAPIDRLDDWDSLYEQLCRRHGIKGIAAFSKEAFEAQLATPGITAFTALIQGSAVGMLLWYRQEDVCYYHLGAYHDRGYQARASFALFSVAIDFFREQGVRWLNLGSGAGLLDSAADGLTRFKRGWTRETKTAYLCGRVFDHDRYRELNRIRQTQTGSYFPAYRLGEFGS